MEKPSQIDTIDKTLIIKFEQIKELVKNAQDRVYKAVNNELINLYWTIGEFISKETLENGWGKQTVEHLSVYLMSFKKDSKGFSARNLWRMKQFYECYKDCILLIPLINKVSWSNHLNILSKTANIEEKEFYLRLCSKHYYPKRDLATLIDNGTYERTMLAKTKLSPLVAEFPMPTEGIFKDVYVFDFVDLDNGYKEYDLRKALIKNLKKFLLEMGHNFSLIDEEYLLQVGMKDYKIDLLLHNRSLNCLVCVELKITEFKPEYLGKLEFYLESLDQTIKQPHENPSIGILICKTKDDEVVKFALNRSMSPAMVARYETELIPKEVLQKKLHELSELIDESENTDVSLDKK